MEVLWYEKSGDFQIATVLLHHSRISVPSQACYLFALKRKGSSKVYMFPLYFRCRGHGCSVTTEVHCDKTTQDKVLKEIFGKDAEELTPIVITNKSHWWTYVEGDPMADIKIMKDLFIDEYIVSRVRWQLAYSLIPELAKENVPEDKMAVTVSSFISMLTTNLAALLFPVVDMLAQRVYKDADAVEQNVLSYFGISDNDNSDNDEEEEVVFEE